MSLVCVLSEQVPEEPVVSPYSGAIFEKRLILKYLEEKKVDPICGREMTADELIEIKVPSIIKPKPPSATSIPALLKTLQDEWDAIMLHSFTLRQQLQATRQELTYSLYQHDAACRVIARLSKELTAAHQPMTDETTEGLTDVIIEKITQKATVLTAERKKRCKTIPENLVKPEELITILKGHNKKVNNVIFHPNCQNIITSSLDSQIRIWSFPESQTTQIVRAHEIAVTSISLHATGDYLLSTSNDENWAFSDINTGKVLVKDGDNSSNHTLTTSKFHPDGLIFGTGTSDSLIKIWDLKDRSNVANFPGHNGAITAMSFSENGYYLATSAEDPVIKLWDLRKLKNFKTIPLDEGYQIKDLYFDYSGTYLAVAGTDVRVYISKQWEHIKTFEDHTALATNVRFGQNASYICSVSLDRSLKIYSN
ncbi:Pre-mRNA-processing factor 19 [Sarcoptes scabiei]|uniref:Pre-mRNA-processing factor 19 n=1 Tax=Sarcoptes scabiei TaxID=52283 RepID=A0A834RAF9_SARSC|nr:Pre-mRNA-processing factor 19 [Sarcoptes scabiei]